jgi:1-pyrroline-5-carboxylate dehydrogenase
VPHRHGHVLANVHVAGASEAIRAVTAARDAWREWTRWPWEERIAVFLRAAALATGPYRERLIAATMLDQSKTVAEAEADSVCEFADFLRFNSHNAGRLLAQQPSSSPQAWNTMDYRPLEGFVYAVTPFNFTAIAGNLITAPALMGNVVVWKPSPNAMTSALTVMEVLEAAGLPPGVVNLVYGDAVELTKVFVGHPDLAGVHFTGSTVAFREIWTAVGNNLAGNRTFPRLVGETGGKGFLLAHSSADPIAVATAILRGAFEYQGQKCSAASRVYVPAELWPEIAAAVAEGIDRLRVGDVADQRTDLGAVISEVAFERHASALRAAAASPDVSVVAGGTVDGTEGWFVSPTLLETKDPDCDLMHGELFGPIVTAYVYDESRWLETIELVDRTSPFALTGSVYCEDRKPLSEAAAGLQFAAGNLYINDKPTGAIVGEQPFGGSRQSGTNDKTGTLFHLSRWVSPRTIKESVAFRRTEQSQTRGLARQVRNLASDGGPERRGPRGNAE